MRKHFDGLAVAITLFAVILTIVFINGERLGITKITDVDSEAHSDDRYFTKNDLDGAWDSANSTRIEFAGNAARITGNGAYVWNGSVVIAKSGTYVISGSLDQGNLVVKADDNSKVWILLDGVSIRNDNDACVVVDQADKVFLTLADGSTNTLESGVQYSKATVSDNTDGTIFSHDDLTINGTGSLIVTAGYKHGISANDDLVITGGNILVNAPEDGLHANDNLYVCASVLDVTAGNDGMSADNEDANLYIESGDITIRSGDEGLAAAGDVTIAGGSVFVQTSTEQGHHGINAGRICAISGGAIHLDSCHEGIQAPYIDITGGNILVYPTDDGLNAKMADFNNMDVPPLDRPSVPSASDIATSSNEPSSNDKGAKQNTPSKGGIEASVGKIPSSNASATNEANDVYLPWIHMSGGSLTIINDSSYDADALDSNGDIVVTGGSIHISMRDDGSNAAIDYGTEVGGICWINGGTVVACGNSFVADGFNPSSTQCSIIYNLDTEANPGMAVSVQDTSGTILLSYDAPYSFTSAYLSSPEMSLGKTYTVTVGDVSEEVTIDSMSEESP